jgi:hypothetical protein
VNIRKPLGPGADANPRRPMPRGMSLDLLYLEKIMRLGRIVKIVKIIVNGKVN